MLNSQDFSQNFRRLIDSLEMIPHNDPVVYAKDKSSSKSGPISRFRSNFIGVSRNGSNWQSLITINKRKTYIASYSQEAQAALSFDFYSILLNGLNAITNFSYTRSELMEMLKIYKQNDDFFRCDTEAYPILQSILQQANGAKMAV